MTEIKLQTYGWDSEFYKREDVDKLLKDIVSEDEQNLPEEIKVYMSAGEYIKWKEKETKEIKFTGTPSSPKPFMNYGEYGKPETDTETTKQKWYEYENSEHCGGSNDYLSFPDWLDKGNKEIRCGTFYRHCPTELDGSDLMEVISNYGFNNNTFEKEKDSDNPVHWKIKISIERIE